MGDFLLSNFISPVVNISCRGGASCSEGEASSPELEPSTLPLEGFQVEGLTPRKMVKVQSVLESLRIRIVKDNGKGAEGENKSALSTDKVYSRRKRKNDSGTRGEDYYWGAGCVGSLEWAALSACGASGGIVILWDSIKFKCTEKVLGSFSVTVKLNSDEERRISEKMGDSRLIVNMRCFDEFIRESGLLDPPLRNEAFTWSNMQVDPICKRLDRFLFSFEWDSFFSQSIQEALPRWTSDHSPICLETNPLKWGPTPFRFENMWLLHPEFKEKFRDWWQEYTVEGWEGHKFMRKLKFIKSKLKEWNIVAFGDLRERKKHILSDLGRIDLIEQKGNLNLDLVSERTLRRKELEDLLLKEEVQWRQKSRVKWIKEGDCNSKFFHRVATGRRSRKFIKSLISERGETLSNIEVISEEIVNFFGNLYSKPEGDSWRIEGIDWAPISGESAVWLDRPFSEEEVRMAVFQLNKEKASGPDDFTIAVYQECWDVIKEDLMRVFFEFHTKGVLSGRYAKFYMKQSLALKEPLWKGDKFWMLLLIVNEVVDEKRRSCASKEGVQPEMGILDEGLFIFI
ncbi:hypothetical protein CK203_083720 [Vitis vinifera]|uniref:Uncharacterized protein n=1 Tax=Vitis vinifera TaxID=29760 RepID=A0A438CYG1_VITVI|nr:hypothetical protein CK203_083720 [Vitis vinifera]